MATAVAARTSVYPTVLVRPVCGYYGSDLYLGRAGKYASFCCPNGSSRKHGCRLHSYKAVGIVERAVVDRLKEVVFSPAFVSILIEEANDHLAAESRRPRGNGDQLRSKIKALSGKRDRLVELWEAGDGEAGTVAARLKKYESQLTEMRERLRAVEGPAVPPTPVTAEHVDALVADLHALIRDDPSPSPRSSAN